MKRREFLTRSGAAVAGGVALGAFGGVTAACGSSEKAEKDEKKTGRRSTHKKKLKFTFKEQKEYETIDDDIAELEEKIADIDRELAVSSGLGDYKKLQELTDERSALSRELDEKTDRWVYLNELAEEIEQQNS